MDLSNSSPILQSPTVSLIQSILQPAITLLIATAIAAPIAIRHLQIKALEMENDVLKDEMEFLIRPLCVIFYRYRGGKSKEYFLESLPLIYIDRKTPIINRLDKDDKMLNEDVIKVSDIITRYRHLAQHDLRELLRSVSKGLAYSSLDTSARDEYYRKMTDQFKEIYESVNERYEEIGDKQESIHIKVAELESNAYWWQWPWQALCDWVRNLRKPKSGKGK